MGGNMQNMMKQMQKMQKEMNKAAAEIAAKEVEGSSGGGMVTVLINGNKEIIKVKLNPAIVDPEDIEMLEDLIVAATNDAIRKIGEISDATMANVTKGIKLPPGLF